MIRNKADTATISTTTCPGRTDVAAPHPEEVEARKPVAFACAL